MFIIFCFCCREYDPLFSLYTPLKPHELKTTKKNILELPAFVAKRTVRRKTKTNLMEEKKTLGGESENGLKKANVNPPCQVKCDNVMWISDNLKGKLRQHVTNNSTLDSQQTSFQFTGLASPSHVLDLSSGSHNNSGIPHTVSSNPPHPHNNIGIPHTVSIVEEPSKHNIAHLLANRILTSEQNKSTAQSDTLLLSPKSEAQTIIPVNTQISPNKLSSVSCPPCDKCGMTVRIAGLCACYKGVPRVGAQNIHQASPTEQNCAKTTDLVPPQLIKTVSPNPQEVQQNGQTLGLIPPVYNPCMDLSMLQNSPLWPLSVPPFQQMPGWPFILPQMPQLPLQNYLPSNVDLQNCLPSSNLLQSYMPSCYPSMFPNIGAINMGTTSNGAQFPQMNFMTPLPNPQITYMNATPGNIDNMTTTPTNMNYMNATPNNMYITAGEVSEQTLTSSSLPYSLGLVPGVVSSVPNSSPSTLVMAPSVPGVPCIETNEGMAANALNVNCSPDDGTMYMSGTMNMNVQQVSHGNDSNITSEVPVTPSTSSDCNSNTSPCTNNTQPNIESKTSPSTSIKRPRSYSQLTDAAREHTDEQDAQETNKSVKVKVNGANKKAKLARSVSVPGWFGKGLNFKKRKKYS